MYRPQFVHPAKEVEAFIKTLQPKGATSSNERDKRQKKRAAELSKREEDLRAIEHPTIALSAPSILPSPTQLVADLKSRWRHCCAQNGMDLKKEFLDSDIVKEYCKFLKLMHSSSGPFTLTDDLHL